MVIPCWLYQTNPNSTTSGGGGEGVLKSDAVYNKLELLASAYNDIQDRLYEIDKSWKNNLMFYGVPYSETEEDDPVLTEEKVCIWPEGPLKLCGLNLILCTCCYHSLGVNFIFQLSLIFYELIF